MPTELSGKNVRVLDQATGAVYGLSFDDAGDCKGIVALGSASVLNVVEGEEQKQKVTMSSAASPTLPFGQIVSGFEMNDSKTLRKSDPSTKYGRAFTLVFPSAEDYAAGAKPIVSILDLPKDLIKAGIAPKPLTEGFNVAAQVKHTKPSDDELEAFLEQYTTDITQQVRDGKVDTVVGREEEVEQAMMYINSYEQSGACFTGDPGCGKSTMFTAIAQHLVNNEDELPEELKGARVLSLNTSDLTLDIREPGEFEKRVKTFTKGLMDRGGVFKGKKIILALDELPEQLAVRMGPIPVGLQMKPFFASKGIATLATTTTGEYKQSIESQPALKRRFQEVKLKPTDAEGTKAVLLNAWPQLKKKHKFAEDLTSEQLDEIVAMSDRYSQEEAQPSKAKKVLMRAASKAQLNHRKGVAQEDIFAAIADMSKLSIEFLSEDDDERYLKMAEEVPKKVLGQPNLLKIIEGMAGARGGLNDENQPKGAWALLGPSGTGKTESVKEFTEQLFGTPDALIKFDMSEFSEAHTVSRLIGAPPGYVGFDDSDPMLTEKVRQQPYSVVLFDEIEKADPSVFQLLLPILNDGQMTDNKGRVVKFNNVYFFFTSNLGAKEVNALLSGKGFGLGAGKIQQTQEKTLEELDKIYERVVKTENGGPFKPEMIGRIGELGGFYSYAPLSPEVISKIAVQQVNKVGERLVKKYGVTIEVSPEAQEELSKLGFDPLYGARPMRGAVRKNIGDPLGIWAMKNRKEINAFVAENGPSKVYLKSLDFATDAPQLQPIAVNDNKVEAPAKKARAPRARNKAAQAFTG